MATEEKPSENKTPDFICPGCGMKNPPIYAESGTEYTHFAFKKGGYEIVSRDVNKAKPPTVFCENCEEELDGDTVAELDFGED